MPVILGIDAAWSVTQPSGVALIAGETAGLRLMSVASSYTEFCTGPGISRGSEPEPPALLERAAALAGRPVSLVSVDMPLARTPITRRRAADDAVSRAFGAMACGTHTPTLSRPGPLAARIRDGFAAGYPLATRTATAGADRGVSSSSPGAVDSGALPPAVQDRSCPCLLAGRGPDGAAPQSSRPMAIDHRSIGAANLRRRHDARPAGQGCAGHRPEGIRGSSRRGRLCVGRRLCAPGRGWTLWR